jgi:hypothetical protein
MFPAMSAILEKDNWGGERYRPSGKETVIDDRYQQHPCA